jgi:hypothetical protein
LDALGGPSQRRPTRGVDARGAQALDLGRAPARLNQDERDAIAAALTARAHERGETERFGDIVVPLGDAPSVRA